MGRALAGDDFIAVVAQAAHVEAVPQVLACTHERWAYSEVQLVNETCLQVLPNRPDTPADSHITCASRSPGLLQRCVDAFGDEAELGAALHEQWWAGVMRQD